MPLFRALFAAYFIAFTAFFPGASFGQDESQAPRPSTSAPSTKTKDAPDIRIKSPDVEGFFRQGRKIFPKNFQGRSVGEAAGPTNALDEYPVGPGDQFLINFWGKVEDNLVVGINSEHKVFIPRIGVVDAKSKTYRELVKAVSKKLNENMKGVDFTISLYKERRFTVYVLGSVNAPGPFEVTASTRASDVIRLAGGVTPTGSQQFIEIRRNGEIKRLDVLKFASAGDFSHNPLLSENDVIFVPVLRDFVTVRGAVVNPGTFEIAETRNLEEVIEKLGGYSIYADASAPLQISREGPTGERVKYDLVRDAKEANSKTSFAIDSFALKSGDEVFVPSSQLLIPSKSESVYVTGEVKQPGAKPYQISMSVEEYIGTAGGLTPRANFDSAVIYKADGSEVALSPRITIQPGDTIYIPEQTFKFWQDHVAILTTFLSLATSIIVLSGR